MMMEERMNQIHELIKGLYPKAVTVKIFANNEGIVFTPEYRTNVKGYGVKNIIGEWVKE